MSAGLKPFPASFYPDTVVVYPPSYTQDLDGGLVRTDGTGVEFAAAVHLTKRSEMIAHAGEQVDLSIGETFYNVLFAADPGVEQPKQLMVWTKHKGVALANPINLISEAKAAPPDSLGVRWTVAAICRS